MKDTVIVVSGGMDSITMLHEFKYRIALGISFNYGSNHNAREIPFAELHCKHLGIPHITIDLGFMPRYFKSSRAIQKWYHAKHSYWHCRKSSPTLRDDGQSQR